MSCRIVAVCSSLSEKCWPYQKLWQLHRAPAVRDLAMLAFTRDSGTFEARVDGAKCTVRRVDTSGEVDHNLLASFLDRWHLPGRTHFVYGGHGMGDYMAFRQFRHALQVHELSRLMGTKRYECAVFDSCFMSSLDCAYHLRHNTPLIGACEGYLWDDDHDLEKHVLTSTSAIALTRTQNVLESLLEIQKSYCTSASRGDFSVLRTHNVADLYDFAQTYVVPQIYERARFLSDSEIEELYRNSPPEMIDLSHAPEYPEERLRTAVQYENSLSPYDDWDRQVIDLRCCIDGLATPSRTQSSTKEKFAANESFAPLVEKGRTLFDKVVVKHQQSAALPYATPLHGLSIVAHRFSALSRPLHDGSYDVVALQRKIDAFIQPQTHAAFPSSTLARAFKLRQPYELDCAATM